jgi:hypothetical protein
VAKVYHDETDGDEDEGETARPGDLIDIPESRSATNAKIDRKKSGGVLQWSVTVYLHPTQLGVLPAMQSHALI